MRFSTVLLHRKKKYISRYFLSQIRIFLICPLPTDVWVRPQRPPVLFIEQSGAALAGFAQAIGRV